MNTCLDCSPSRSQHIEFIHSFIANSLLVLCFKCFIRFVVVSLRALKKKKKKKCTIYILTNTNKTTVDCTTCFQLAVFKICSTTAMEPAMSWKRAGAWTSLSSQILFCHLHSVLWGTRALLGKNDSTSALCHHKSQSARFHSIRPNQILHSVHWLKANSSNECCCDKENIGLKCSFM